MYMKMCKGTGKGSCKSCCNDEHQDEGEQEKVNYWGYFLGISWVRKFLTWNY